MLKIKCALAIAVLAAAPWACAQQASQELPYVGNVNTSNFVEPVAQSSIESQREAPSMGSRSSEMALRAERLATGVESRMDRLSGDETQMLDQISSAAAARAVLALRCEGERFERVSKAIQLDMEAKVDQVSQRGSSARAYARDSAQMKYKAMAQANMGVQCSDLDNLRHIAASQGFQ